jgi:chromosome segregation ATPase
MMCVTLLVAVTAITGGSNQQPLAVEVQPNGKLATPSLIQTNTNTLGDNALLEEGFRGRQAADDSLTSTLASTETRQKAEIDSSALEREHRDFSRQVSQADVNDAVMQKAEQIADETKELKTAVEQDAMKDEQAAKILDAEEKAAKESRDENNGLTTAFGTLETQAKKLAETTESLGSTSGQTSSAQQDLTEDKATESNGLAETEGNLDILSQKVAGLQEAIGSKLNGLSKTTEAASKNALLMTGTLNNNAMFIKDVVSVLARMDSQASTIIDSVVGLLKQTHKVEMAREAMDKAKSEKS